MRANARRPASADARSDFYGCVPVREALHAVDRDFGLIVLISLVRQ